jgi:hypothetical protein
MYSLLYEDEHKKRPIQRWYSPNCEIDARGLESISDRFDRDVHHDYVKIDSSTLPSDTAFKEVIFNSSGNYWYVLQTLQVPHYITVSSINDGKDRAKYYAIFLNYVSAVARQFGAKVIKNCWRRSLLVFSANSGYYHVRRV